MEDRHSDRQGAAALLAGTGLLLMVALAHPTGGDVLHHGAAGLGRIVHGVAIVALILLTMGFFRLSQRLGFARGLVLLAFIVYAFGAAATLSAAVMSGFVATHYLEHAPDHGALNAAAFAARLNQAYAGLGLALQAGAFVLWGAAWPGRRAADWALRALGILVGLAVPFAHLHGLLPLDVTGFAIRMAAFALFTIAAAAWLLARKPQIDSA